MPGSRLLPTAQRSPLPVAPTTSRWWRTHVLFRSWLNGHRHRWLAPLLVCVPPIGVAMVWAGATRPGHQRRWLTAAAGVWMIALGLLVSLLALPGASTADAGGAPPRAGGPAVASPTPSATRDDAARASAVRAAATPGAGVGGAAVATSTSAAGAAAQDGSSGGTPASAGSGGGAQASTPRASSAPSTPSKPSASPKPTRPTPTPTPPGNQTKPPHHPDPHPTVPTENPFTPCSVEGTQAVSPNGFPLRCYRTPIGLYWLWGQ